MKNLTRYAIAGLMVAGIHFSASAQNAAGSTQTASATAQNGMNEGQIAEVVKTVNEAEIDAAKVAQSKASNKAVKEFAKSMIDEHKKNTKDGKHIMHKADVKAESNEMAKEVKEDAKNKMAALKKVKGAEFDAMYMDQQITMHQQVMNDLEQKYIPAAKNPEFKQYLQTTHEHVAGHLAKAKEIQATLAK